VDTGNIQVSPNDQSLDSQVNNEPAVNEEEKLHSSTANNEPPVNDQSLDSEANNDVASDSVVPELLADHDENCKCDWSHIVACTFPQLKPLKCTVDGCNKLVHHLCQIAFEQREGFPETLPLKCCLHHPQSPFRASKPPPVNDPDDKLHSSTATNSKTSMADSSRLPNDAGKKAATTDDSSSSDESSLNAINGKSRFDLKHPRFFRIRRRRCPNSTCEGN
jgi:hypothetical protein